MRTRSDAADAANGSDCCETPPEPPLWVQETAARENVRLKHDLSYYRSEAFRLEKALAEANAALKIKEGAVSYMERNSAQFYDEWPKLRKMLKRWDERNWADLCVSALRGHVGDAAEMDYTHDITDSLAFKQELKAIHRRRDEVSRDWLRARALRPAKQLLAKCTARMSLRRCGALAQVDVQIRLRSEGGRTGKPGLESERD